MSDSCAADLYVEVRDTLLLILANMIVFMLFLVNIKILHYFVKYKWNAKTLRNYLNARHCNATRWLQRGNTVWKMDIHFEMKTARLFDQKYSKTVDPSVIIIVCCFSAQETFLLSVENCSGVYFLWELW